MSKTQITWTPETEGRMKRVPFFVRPLAKRKAEEVARERGIETMTLELLDELEKKFKR